MTSRLWLKIGTAIDLLLFLPTAYMAVSVVDVAQSNPESGSVWGVAFLFLAAPVFTLACPMTAWKAHARGRSRHAAGMMLAPVVYTGFLILVLLYG